ncbi:MAG: hypothetical protein AAB383_00670 [Patescibacteria group bacterium]
MYPDKKPPSKKEGLFFTLGIASFFVILLTGLILLLDFPRIYKIISETILIGAYLLAFASGFFNEKFEDFVKSNKMSSFMNGLSLSFLLVILLFASLMVWGALQV